MKKALISLALATITLGICIDANAQAITGYTSIDYYPETDQLDAYSETDLDWDLVGDYSPFVALTVVDDNSGPISYDTARDYNNNGFIFVERLITGTNPASTYTAVGAHRAYAEIWDYYEEWPYGIWYYDDFYFTDFENQQIYTPWYHDFYSPTWTSFRRRAQAIILGTTYDSDSVTTPKPASLAVLSIETLPTGTTGNYGCTPDQDYGIKVKIKYQVIGDNDQPLQKGNMRPQEKLTNSVINGQSQGDPIPNWTDIGPTRITGTSRLTDSNGQFFDAPYGICGSTTFTHTATQQISILVGRKRYLVRTNAITESSSASGGGSTSNGSDIQKTRP